VPFHFTGYNLAFGATPTPPRELLFEATINPAQLVP